MTNKRYIVFLSSITILSLGISIFALFKILNAPTIKFIDLNKVYANFQMKKELEQRLLAVSTVLDAKIDSIAQKINEQNVNIEFLDSNKMTPELKNLLSEYLTAIENKDDELEAITEMYDLQVWTQINQLVSDYGESNNIDILLGAEGSGTIMFANKFLDATDDIILFINNKYEDK